MNETTDIREYEEVQDNQDEANAPRFGYIEADTVLKGQFPGTDKIPAIDFTYHPMDGEDVFVYQNHIQSINKSDNRAFRVVAIKHCLQKFMKTWSFRRVDPTDPSGPGSPLPFNDIKQLKGVPSIVIDYITDEIYASGKLASTLAGK